MCPETPGWLYWKGRSEEALVAKQKLQGPASQAPSVRHHGQANEAEKAELGTGNGNGDDTDIRQPLRDLPERRHSEAESSYQVNLIDDLLVSFVNRFLWHQLPDLMQLCLSCPKPTSSIGGMTAG